MKRHAKDAPRTEAWTASGLLIAVCLAALTLACLHPDRMRAEPATTSIVGGKAATIAQWPWQVALAVSRNRAPRQAPTKRAFCGGSLLAPTVVLTAGHCGAVIDAGRPEHFSVIAGRTRLDRESQGQEVGVKEIHLPRTRSGVPHYVVNPFRWDIALLELDQPLPDATIEIAGPDERALVAPGRRAFETGWGMHDLERAEMSPRLRVSATMIQPNRVCRDTLVGALAGVDREVHLCLGSPRGASATCHGDSGGPTVVASSAGYRLVGVTSFGTDLVCATDSASLDAFAASSELSGWIREQVLSLAGVDPVGTGATAGPPPRSCRVPQLLRMRLSKARAALRKGGCRVGKVRSRKVPAKVRRRLAKRVLSSEPSAGWIKSRGFRVDLTLAAKADRRKPRRR